MIKRAIGILVAVATIAILVFTVLHRANFRSMFDRGSVAAERSVIPAATLTPAQRTTSAQVGDEERKIGSESRAK